MIESLFFFYPKAYKYQEEYQKALEGFSKAMALDAGWVEPQEQEMRLMDYLSRLTTLQSSQVFKKKEKKWLFVLLLSTSLYLMNSLSVH